MARMHGRLIGPGMFSSSSLFFSLCVVSARHIQAEASLRLGDALFFPAEKGIGAGESGVDLEERSLLHEITNGERRARRDVFLYKYGMILVADARFVLYVKNFSFCSIVSPCRIPTSHVKTQDETHLPACHSSGDDFKCVWVRRAPPSPA
jgi:hypothetical protein